MKFDLSYLQALTYLTLVTLKKSDVKTIAKVSKVARQDIYRIMPTLQDLGLVEEIIGSPTLYLATPLKNAASILLDSKKQELTTLVHKGNSLVEHFSSLEEVPSHEDEKFIITSEFSVLINLHEKMTSSCQKSLDILVPLRGVPSKVEDEWNHLRDILQQKKIEVRLITHRPERRDSAFVFWEPLLKQSFFHVRYLGGPIDFGMHIFDGKRLTMSVDGFQVLPCLWSNSPNFMDLATAYFNKLWLEAEE